MAVIARHLCGWIMGHSGPVDRFLVDAELIVNDVEDCGINVAPSREQVMVALHSICVAPVDYAIGMACTSASNHDQQADAVLALIQGCGRTWPVED